MFEQTYFVHCSGFLFFCIFQFVLAGVELSNERQTVDICLLPRLNIVVAGMMGHVMTKTVNVYLPFIYPGKSPIVCRH